MRTETIIALSANDFSKLDHLEKDLRKTAIDSFIKALKNVEQQIEALTAERDEYKAAYERGVKLALEKSVVFEEMRKQRDTAFTYLSQACDEMEGIFDTTGQLASLEIATDYTCWARFLEKNHGRDNHRADRVQEWIDR